MPIEPIPPEPPAATATNAPPAADTLGSNGHAALPDTGGLEPAGTLGRVGPSLAPDPGLYAVLGLHPSVSDAEIQTTYRRQAAKLLGSGSNDIQGLKQLNVAYEVLGNPVRRAEYDRLRLTPVAPVAALAPIQARGKAPTPVKRRRRPRQAVQPRYAGLGDVLVVLVVVGLAVVAAMLIIPRVSINLTALNVVQSVLPLPNNSSRRAVEPTLTPAPATAVPTATPQPGLAERFLGSTIGVSNPTPARGTTESVFIRLRRDGQPAANVDVWTTVKYRTTEERWPASGAVSTDASGNATIAFNIGSATSDFPVTVRVFAQVNDQQLTWSTTFTPH
jgi:DnaJ domain